MAAGQHGGSGVTLRGFIWTAKRDALLAELRRSGLSLKETATAIGCDVEFVKVRVRELGLTAAPRKAATTREIATVPRPVAPPRPTLIDISKAPSSMERLADRWAGRA